MKDALRRRIEDVDRIGGRIYSRFWGTVFLVGVLVVAVPVMIGTLRDRHWIGFALSAGVAVAGLLFVRYLFSRNRRLSELE